AVSRTLPGATPRRSDRRCIRASFAASSTGGAVRRILIASPCKPATWLAPARGWAWIVSLTPLAIASTGGIDLQESQQQRTGQDQQQPGHQGTDVKHAQRRDQAAERFEQPVGKKGDRTHPPGGA